MSEAITFRFDVDGTDFTSAGQASVQVKKNLRQLGISPEVIRRVSIAMYEGEINMVIHAGGGEAEVTVTESSIKIVLADHGPGIAKEDLPHVKERFYKGRGKERGSGIGLAVCEEIVTRHSGKLIVDNAPAGGALITVLLPIETQ